MRNLFLILLLANVVYFLWARWVAEPTLATGVVRHAESALKPRAELAPPMRLAPAASPVCLSIGGFSERAQAENTLDKLRLAGVAAALREAPGEVFDGHWVQVPGFETRSVANRELRKLNAGGLTEAYVVGEEDTGFAISLGLFSELARAERVELQAKSLGFTAVIEDRMKPGQLFWIDIRTERPDAVDALIGPIDPRERLTGDAARCP